MKNRDHFAEAVLVACAAYASGFFLIILPGSCSPPPPLDLRHPADLCGSFFPFAAIGPGAAFGDVTIRNNGEVQNGSVEIKQDRDGLIKADFYGPLGIAVASLHADSLQGSIAFDDREYTFTHNKTMDTLPVTWGKGLTFGDFLRILSGRIPSATAMETLCKKQPDSLVKKRNAIIALWKTDSMEMRAEISGKSRQLAAISFYFKKQEPFWFLNMGSFKRGIAHKIEFSENDGNYFLIKYTKVTLR